MINANVRTLNLRDEVCLSMPAGKDPHMVHMVKRYDPFARVWDAVHAQRKMHRYVTTHFSYAPERTGHGATNDAYPEAI